MKKKFIIPFLAVIVFFSNTIYSNTTSDKNPNKDPEKDRVIVYVLKNILSRYHYVQKELNDEFSEHVYTSFIDGLDPNKRYFTQEDLTEFSQFKYQIDDQLKNTEIHFYKLVYNRFLEKLTAAKNNYRALLAQPFNYKKNEVINVDYEKIPFAKNESELVDYWRKQLKLSILSRIEDADDTQNKKAKKDKKLKLKKFYQLEIEARKEVLKNMNELYERIDELENSDWYSTFLNSVVSGFDPHTTYMSPRIKSRFDQEMSGKLEGIGARLQKKGMYTHIVELISGGPAWKQGELEPEDIILKVAQGDAEPLDIVGMRLDDAIKFIKGKKGTEVRLTVKKKIDGSTKIIPIIRDVVELDETFVKSSIVEKNGQKYGVIDLPRFYIDFNDLSRRDAAKDMEQEIERLKSENVKGIIVDLRDNGGGSLKTAIEIGGLFIKKGPIVQVKYRGEDPLIKNDTDSKIQWNGPLVVMVNEFSASASEIFAAAMQDYKRGVIIGGKQTYGKGTVQNVMPINRFYEKYPSDLGALKMTIQKFYRINGGSTQIEGVYSDISLPTRYSYMKFGERDLDGALPWDKVLQADYNPTNSYSNFNDAVYNSKQRVLENEHFNKINKYAKWLKKNQEERVYSLKYSTFKKESTKKIKEGELFKDIFKFDSNLTFNSPKYEINLFKKDTVLKEKRVVWHKNLKKDIYLNEALNVLSELKMNRNYTLVKQ
ncbi:carboxy terminal-processing peptidase [Tenacibaculum finnmarkense genomovar finnmarkense]|uniref:carboxy terminal-processing peptidase n=1 Tax=Tenacibaculum finnmarkense TaxID=2781243 RepID=UPI001E55EDAA|nr:carboxy terminal-processing peptidase [Tenacibaculum finnmarkense]MCD8416272.1 carboxy terminal-processing peptidase [Tenacibaculum finnmarkense genomovar finnmarkense]MCG8184932.1 carboxy terminal-processing peptidase [Tenacibaculum finnmarkense genomovar finnmarkense]MCG8201234.1 carboxy terminal-processing peptidase [Tenacibaculum finnmarkense genomovar finnmarkense]MCG8208891.1 carboxy terminal-processing peptidase [Tenacibaculum finnmarkense genomovar finnmarkense]MCG8211794.1 carboxy 